MLAAGETETVPRRMHALVIATALVVVGYRGWDARTWLMYLDAVFVKHAVAPEVIHGGIRGTLDPLGLLNSFSGYIHLVARMLAKLFTSVTLDAYPTLTWLTATIVWSMAVWIVFLAVTTAAASQVAGVAAAAAVVFHPSTNIILLGQLNALQWPMLLACTIVAVTAYRPRTTVGRVALVVLFVATALNAALTFLIIGVLAFSYLRDRSRRYTAILLAATAVPFALQVITYLGQEARQVKSRQLASVVRETLYAAQILVPGSLRNGVDTAPSGLGLVLIITFWTTLVTALFAAVVRLRTLDPDRARLALTLVTTGVIFLVVSVAFNGNLNHQYLVVPFGCWWSAGAVGFSALHRQPASRLVAQFATIAAVGIFAFAAAPQVDKNLRDPFFTQPFVGDWRSTLDDARRECEQAVIVNPSATSAIPWLPCTAID
jgi:hypothetical protein